MVSRVERRRRFIGSDQKKNYVDVIQHEGKEGGPLQNSLTFLHIYTRR
jgi:hypothetical protein